MREASPQETVILWRAQIAQNADGTPHGLLSGESPREPLAAMIARLRDHGLPDPIGQSWQFRDLLTRREELKRTPSLFSDSTVGEIRGFFASADQETAHWYAGSYGQADAVVVAFEAPMKALIVDCRDFLDRVFLFAESFIRDRKSSTLDAMRTCVTRYWGDAVVEYFDMIGSGVGARDLVNAAAHDFRVLRAHIANTAVLEGRGGLRFRNQVAVLTPIGPEMIRSIEPPVPVTLEPVARLRPLIFP